MYELTVLRVLATACERHAEAKTPIEQWQMLLHTAQQTLEGIFATLRLEEEAPLRQKEQWFLDHLHAHDGLSAAEKQANGVQALKSMTAEDLSPLEFVLHWQVMEREGWRSSVDTLIWN